MIDMLYIEYKMTKLEYNNTFKILQAYLRMYRPSHQLRKDKRDRGAYITNGLAKIGFQEIRLRSNIWGYRSLEIRLRPQLLINPNGYYRLTSLSEFEAVNQNFNYVLRDILSLRVPLFFKWNVKRVEPAIDIKIKEHLLEKYLLLFKKGNIPGYFFDNEQTLKYWNSKTNLYLVSANKAVNWYNRFETLLIKERQSGKKFVDFSETKGLLRFETQVRNCDDLVLDVLNQDRLQKEVIWFYKAIVGQEDFYTLKNAIQIINQSITNQGKRMELERIVRLIDKSGGICEAKVEYTNGKEQRKAADNFSKRINQIRKLGINPVILPSDWKIERLENLYFRIKNGFEYKG
ncbi:hypothetical protein [Peribacillus asahii]|uniref:hypothetical protein n=1 Tax=Peribacillus asahii TaxID=228899 RepID=UPI002079DB3A|nr:hypothetical protein [Peribacillus asahii]USK86147.1 hypothetical protein LIT35_05765 [Peribacillus asahii]